MRPRSLLLLLLLAIPLSMPAQPAPNDDKAIRRRPVQILWDFKIPARDGVKLSAVVYRPADQKEPLPVILAMTPYGASTSGASGGSGLAKQGNYFARNGYVFVAMDMRGRGSSEGVFVPGEVEGKDGYDAVEFLAKQPWCNGDVATHGGSWLGFAQWSTAKEFPPHLKAMAPVAAVYPGVDFPNHGGLFNAYTLRWLAYVDGRSPNSGLFAESAYWSNLVWAHYTSGRPFEKLDETSGITSTVFRKWLSHPHFDAFWEAMTPNDEQMARINIPILTITGHYDADQFGALTYYMRHMRLASPEAASRHDLIIGPYDHFGTRTPRESVGGLKFPSAALLDMEKLHKEWYDHVLKKKPRPEFLKDRVAYWVVGADTWRYARSWDVFSAAPLAFHLAAGDGDGHDVLQSVSLTKTAPAEARSLQITLDPTRLIDRDVHEELESDSNYLLAQRSSYAVRESYVFFQSPPFAEDTEISGIPALRLWISSNVPDADLEVSLHEVRPDGTAVYLSGQAQRLRHAMDPRKEQLLPIDTPVELHLRDFSFISQKIMKNSRIRLTIGLPTGPDLQRNAHDGGIVASTGIEKARVATIKLLTGPQYASVIQLPRPKK